jgi:Tol biopolymer transport system component
MRQPHSPAFLVLSSFLLLFGAAPRSAWAQGSAGFDSCGVLGNQGSTITTVDFHPYKLPAFRYPYGNRDLEFLWSDSYSALFGRPLNAVRPPGPDTDLDLLGVTICHTLGTGAFGFSVPFIRLIYDYLRAPGFGRPPSVDVYNTNQLAVLGFAAAQPTYGDLDRNHADTYIFAPKFSGDPLWHAGGQYDGDGGNPSPQSPSAFLDAEEDVSSGHPASLDTAAAYALNSVDVPGPKPSQVGVSGTGDWTAPRGVFAYTFNHEFQHMVNNHSPGSVLTELLSAAATALTGPAPGAPTNDVPYTWSVFRASGNYQAWGGLTAYLTYNFRGTDPTFNGRADDLLWRWARSSDRSMIAGLGQQLLDANCTECAAKTYFNGLSATDRSNLLIHNWRVASYVNNTSLAEGQYGFTSPPLGYDPIAELGSWQDIDHLYPPDDTVNIEREIQLDTSHLTRQLTFAGRPTNIANPENSHVAALDQFGSEYWVIRSDPSLWGANRDLVVRIMPESRCSLRLFASAVAYTEENLPGGLPDKLWRHPSWAHLAVAPKWADLSLTTADPDPMEIVIPNFGQTNKAALVVITTGGPVETDGANEYSLAYRMNVGIRTAPYQSPNPVHVTSYSSPYFAALPTWAPAGDQVAFSRSDTGPGPDQVYRAPAAGGTPTALFPQPYNQYWPDWSPRGDWVAFDQDAGTGSCDIWAVNTENGQSRRITSSPLHESGASFSPNGQQLVYVRGIPYAGYQLRRVNLDGSNDAPVFERTTAVVNEPRWGPGGSTIYVVVSSGGVDSLYAVDAYYPNTVTQVARLASGELHFDPPRGAGRWAWDMSWQPLGTSLPTGGQCGFPSNESYRRVGLRDTPAGATETIYSRPRSDVQYPRWSWDGTRVAFVSSRSMAPVTPANILVGQVSYDHAPVFTGLGDQALTRGVAFQLSLSASDPDGETVSYECPQAFWPPGAGYNSGSHTFYWADPQPAGAEYFVVFRALDPSGGVSHRVVKYTVQSPGGGCPFVDTRTTAGWQVENSILGRSLTGALGLDAYRLKYGPEVASARIRLRLRENEQEFTTLDMAQVVAVDHAPSVRAYTVGNHVYVGTRVPAYHVTTVSGQDVTSLVSGTGSFYQGAPGDTLMVQMSAPRAGAAFGATSTQDGGGGEGGMEGDPKETEMASATFGTRAASPFEASAVDAGVLGSTGILVQVPDGIGGWRTMTQYYPRRYQDDTVLDSLGAGPCRLIFVGRHRLHFIGRYLRSASQPAPQALELLAARHSRLGDMKQTTSAADGAAAPLVPGDTLTMDFASGGTIPAGSVRDYFFLSTGVYSGTAPLAQQGSVTEGAPLPTQLALAQNHPNPFDRTTTIEFALPQPAPVRLEIFDLQGRLVAVLASGLWPAGFQSVQWDRRDGRGALARPGVYLYRLTAGEFRDTKKLLLSK